MSSRSRELQIESGYYPTPPDVVRAIRQRLPGLVPARERVWLDPCAGTGALLAHIADDPSRRRAIELQCEFEPWLTQVCGPGHVRIADALKVPWQGGADVIMNPDFTVLRPFIQRMIEHIDGTSNIGLVFHRSGWMQRQSDIPLPNNFEVLEWRPSFTPNGQTDWYEYAWSLYLPHSACRQGCQMARLRRPTVSDADWADYRRRQMLCAGIPPAQMSMDLGA